jgi:signal transduction histidine kinase
VFSIKLDKKDACSIVKNVFDELKLTFNNSQIDLEIVFPKKEIFLMLDEPLFRIIVGNLIINSIHYTEKGKIKVKCDIVKKGQSFGGKHAPERCLALTVSDTGHGIPIGVQKKIFTKFFRANNAKKILINGTGLGLYLVKSILDHSGGSIWFSSREKKGSSFFVTIPMTGMKRR